QALAGRLQEARYCAGAKRSQPSRETVMPASAEAGTSPSADMHQLPFGSYFVRARDLQLLEMRYPRLSRCHREHRLSPGGSSTERDAARAKQIFGTLLRIPGARGPDRPSVSKYRRCRTETNKIED